ncbi:MAG: peptide deformylase [bacterium]|jgi:peptide deformylase
MAVKDILLLGDSRLYEHALQVKQAELPWIQEVIRDLHDTLLDFRKKFGAGRAIAAPQIGVPKRLIYLYINEPPVIFINPQLTDKSDEMMEIWDDCMSFPNLYVKVLRHKKCTITYRDLTWQKNSLPLEGDLAELLQHEYDHLNGILAVSRALDGQSFALRR